MSCVRTTGVPIGPARRRRGGTIATASVTARGNRTDLRICPHVVAHFEEEARRPAMARHARRSVAGARSTAVSSTDRPRRACGAPKPDRPAYTPGRSSRSAPFADRWRTATASPANAAGRPGRHSSPAPTQRTGRRAGPHDPLADDLTTSRSSPPHSPGAVASARQRTTARRACADPPGASSRPRPRDRLGPGRCGCPPSRPIGTRLFCNPKDLT